MWHNVLLCTPAAFHFSKFPCGSSLRLAVPASWLCMASCKEAACSHVHVHVGTLAWLEEEAEDLDGFNVL
jgi:hypothetical protein